MASFTKASIYSVPNFNLYDYYAKQLQLKLSNTNFKKHTTTSENFFINRAAASCNFSLLLYHIKLYIMKNNNNNDNNNNDNNNNIKEHINSTNSYGYTPLHETVERGDLNCTSLLIRYGADILLKSTSLQENAIDIARRKKHMSKRHLENFDELIKYRVELSSNNCIVDQLNGQLEAICLQNDFDQNIEKEVQKLIEKGAKVDSYDPLKYCLIHLACHLRNELLLLCLLALQNIPMYGFSGQKSTSLLHIACEEKLNCRFGLAKRFPRLIIFSDQFGFLPMHISAQNGDFDFLQFLFDRKQFSTRLPSTSTTIMYGRDVIFHDLLSVTYVVDFKLFPETPVSANVCKKNKKSKIKKKKLKNASIINFNQNIDSYTSFYKVPKEQESLNMLSVVENFSIDLQTHNEQNILHFACANGSVNIVHLLVDYCERKPHKCPAIDDFLNSIDNIPLTPLECALKQGHYEIAQFLISKGSSFNFASEQALIDITIINISDYLLEFLSLLPQIELTYYIKLLSCHQNEKLANMLFLHLNSLENFPLLRFLFNNGMKISLFNFYTTCKHFIVEKRQENLQFMFENFKMVQDIKEEHLILKLEEILNKTIWGIALVKESVKCCDYQIFSLLLNYGANPSKFIPAKLEDNLLLISAKQQSEDGLKIFIRLVQIGVTAEYSTILKQIYNECSTQKREILIALDAFKSNFLHIQDILHFCDNFTPIEAAGKLIWSGFAMETIDFRLLSIACKIIKEIMSLAEEIEWKQRGNKRKQRGNEKQHRESLFLSSEIYKYLAQMLFIEEYIFTENPKHHIQTSNITMINLTSNNLQSIPIDFFEFPNLEEFFLANNKLSQLPEPLQTTDFSSCGENEIIRGEYKCKKLRKINVSHNCLLMLPEDLFFLPKLEEVNASNNQIRSLPESTWFSFTLKILNLDYNDLSYLIDDSKRSSMLKDLPSLFHSINKKANVIMSEKRIAFAKKQLSGSTTDESVLNDEVCFVQQIDNTDFSKLSFLNKLSLCYNNFEIFPYEIPCLSPNLRSLRLDNNRIKTVNLLHALPKSIRNISLDNNQIEDIADCITKPKKCSSPFLESSILKGELCQHRVLQEFPFLQVISLNNNRLSYFPIKTLNSSSSDKALRVPWFPVLSTLSLERNKLQEISEEISLLTSLKYLSISYNPDITQLPSSIKSLTNLISLRLDELVIENIPNQLNGNTFAEEIRAHFISSSDVVPYRSLKLIFLGDQNKGKSFILKMLTSQKNFVEKYFQNCDDLFDENKGLNVTEWNLHSSIDSTEPINFTCWNFVGNINLFPAFRGFLCRRAIYIIVWNFEDFSNGFEDVKKWLSKIEECAPSSKCILICVNFNKNDSRQIDIDSIKNIESLYLLEIETARQINISTIERDIVQLREYIFSVASALREKHTSKESYIEQLVPRFYVKLKEIISKMKCNKFTNNNGFAIIHKQKFYEIIAKIFSYQYIKIDQVEYRNALDFLHKNRNLLYFSKDPYVNDYLVLDLEWLCNKLVAVLNYNTSDQSPLTQSSHLLESSRGIVATNWVEKILEVNCETNEENIKISLKFGRKFEVLLELTERYYFLPTNLGENPSEAVNLLFEIDLDWKDPDHESEISYDMLTFFKTRSLSGHNKPRSDSTYPFLRVINKVRERNVSISGRTSSNQREWNRFFSATSMPIDFWPKLLARIIADKAYLNSVIFYMLPYIDSLPTDEKQFVKTNLEKNIYWKVWQSGITLHIMSNEILTIFPFPLSSINCEKVCVDSVEILKSNVLFSSLINLTVRELESINYTTARIPIEESLSNPSSFLQFSTWLLDHTQSHINCVLQEWSNARNILRRHVKSRRGTKALQKVRNDVIQVFIPCQDCFEEFCRDSENNINQKPKSRISRSSRRKKTISTYQNETTKQYVNNPFFYTLEYLCQNESSQTLTQCAIHGPILMVCLAPDILLLDFPVSMLYSNDCINVGAKLGEGGFGTVRRGSIRLNTSDIMQDIAIKQPKEDRLMSKLQIYESCAQEARIIMHLSHKSILKMVGVCRLPYLILMEYAPNLDIANVIKTYYENGIYILSSSIIDTCVQVSSALAYLHSHQIIFRDLKPENVLVFEFPTPETQLQLGYGEVYVKLADYGIASYIGPYGIAGEAGTIVYTAPEVNQVDEVNVYGTSVDTYSFGLLMYSIITLESPFLRDELVFVGAKAASGFRPVVPNSARPQSVYLYDLMRWCWTANPHERPTCSQINVIVSKEAFRRLVFIFELTQSDSLELVCACVINPDQIDHSAVFSENYDSMYMYPIEDSFDATKNAEVLKSSLDTFTYNKTNTVSRVLNNCEIWFCMNSGVSKYFQVSQSVYTINQLPLNEKVTCMVATVDHIWVGTLSKGIFIFSVHTHKIVDEWRSFETISSPPVILFLYYSAKRKLVIASLSNNQLYIFNTLYGLRKSFSYVHLRSPALCLTSIPYSKASEEIWCGCEGYLARYLIENIKSSGLKPHIITKYGNDMYFPKGKAQNMKIRFIVAIPEEKAVLCASGSFLSKFSFSSGYWLDDLNCNKRDKLANEVYSNRVTSLTIHKSIVFVGTGSGSVLIVDGISLRIIDIISEYSGPIRMLSVIAVCNTTSGFGRVLMRPKLPSKGYRTSERKNSDFIDNSADSKQLLLLCIGTYFNGIVGNYSNYPDTLESDFGPSTQKRPTKPLPEDNYLSLWDLNKWFDKLQTKIK